MFGFFRIITEFWMFQRIMGALQRPRTMPVSSGGEQPSTPAEEYTSCRPQPPPPENDNPCSRLVPDAEMVPAPDIDEGLTVPELNKRLYRAMRDKDKEQEAALRQRLRELGAAR